MQNHVNENGTIILQHDALAFGNNLRAYIDTLLGTLLCRMDVQVLIIFFLKKLIMFRYTSIVIMEIINLIPIII